MSRTLSSSLIFQSTLPVRGATSTIFPSFTSAWISIHAPREGSDLVRILIKRHTGISIHAPREGSDHNIRFTILITLQQFQSTLPVRGATSQRPNDRQTLHISIHAPREGSDQNPSHEACHPANFNPRSP